MYRGGSYWHKDDREGRCFLSLFCNARFARGSFEASHVSYQRLDGTMFVAAPEKSVNDLKTVREVCVQWYALHVTFSASQFIFCWFLLLASFCYYHVSQSRDSWSEYGGCLPSAYTRLWWNPTTKDQAVDRADRIGQTRTVTVSRLTVKDSVEDCILAMQVKTISCTRDHLGFYGHFTILNVIFCSQTI